MVEELTTIQEVHDEVELGWRLEGVVELDDERTVNFLQYVSFGYIPQDVSYECE